MIKKVLFSFGLFIVLLEFALRFGGWLVTQGRAKVISSADAEVTILVLGESTTDAFVSSWPLQLEKMLRRRFPDRSINVINEGRGGTTTAFIAARLGDQLDLHHPDIVVTMMGVNDDDSYLVYRQETSHFIFFLKDLRVFKFFRAVVRQVFTGTAYAPQTYLPVPSDPLEFVFEKERQLRQEGKIAEAEIMYESLLGNPTYDGSVILLKLGYVRLHRGDVLGAKTAFETSLRESSNSAHPFIGLGIIARDEGRIDDAIALLRQAVDIDPDAEPSAYLTLATLYKQKNLLSDAIAMYEEGLRYNTNPDHVVGSLTTLYKKQGMTDEAIKKRLATLAPQTNELTIDTTLSFSDITRYHYRLIHDMIVNEGGIHVVMQYPTLDIDALREMLPADDSSIFVSNKENFQQALHSKPYEMYFSDRFGSTWGHTTVEGDKLIASAAAEVISAYMEDTLR